LTSKDGPNFQAPKLLKVLIKKDTRFLDPLSFVCGYPVDELQVSAPIGWPTLLLLFKPCCLDVKEGQSYKMMQERETSLTKTAIETSIIL
jgi:hypothetical protein